MDRWCVPAELPPLLLSLRCRGGQARAHRLRLWAKPVATERSAVGTLPARVSRLLFGRPALRGRRRKAEEHNGFGGAQHRGTAEAGRGRVGGRCARRWRGPAGCRRRGGCGCRRTPCGRTERGVPQEQEHGREFGGQVRRKALGVVERRRGVDQPTEPGGESAAGRGHPVLAQFSRVAAVPQVEAGPQDRLHLARPATVGMILPQLLAALEQVVETRLVQSVVAAIRRPPVAHEHAGVVGPQHRGGIGEPPAGADGVDRRLRGDERPQPDAADAPAGPA